MAKKLVAVTEIRHDDMVIPAGESVDASKFDKKQLEALYDAGAIRIDNGDEPKSSSPSAEEVAAMRAEADKKNAEEAKSDEQRQLHAENMHISADQAAAASSPAGEPKPTAKSDAQAVSGTPSAKSASAPAKEAANGKGNTK